MIVCQKILFHFRLNSEGVFSEIEEAFNSPTLRNPLTTGTRHAVVNAIPPICRALARNEHKTVADRIHEMFTNLVKELYRSKH